MVTRKRVHGSGNLRSTVQKDFCNNICHNRTHAYAANSTRADVLSDHASKGNPTYCSANDAWACSEACR
jgi:hypothetical protein